MRLFTGCDSVRHRTVLFAGQSEENLHLGDTWEFDGEDWTQQQDAGPPPRGVHSMAFDSVSNRVIMFGGVDVNNHGLADTWAWDGSEWVQIAEIGPQPRDVDAHRSAHLLAFSMVLRM